MPAMKKPASGCASSRAPCGRTVPQLCRLGSISGADAGRAFQPRIEGKADLAQHRKIGPEPGRDDRSHRRERARRAGMVARDAQALPVARDLRDAERCHALRPRRSRQGARAWMPSAPRSGSASSCLAAEAASIRSLRMSQRISRAGRRLAQCGKFDQRVDAPNGRCRSPPRSCRHSARDLRPAHPECRSRYGPRIASSPIAGNPSAPAGLGVLQVPEASITARASMRRAPPRACDPQHEGQLLAPGRTHLVGALRVTATTRALRWIWGASAAASGSR